MVDGKKPKRREERALESDHEREGGGEREACVVCATESVRRRERERERRRELSCKPLPLLFPTLSHSISPSPSLSALPGVPRCSSVKSFPRRVPLMLRAGTSLSLYEKRDEKEISYTQYRERNQR
jgi:hypothetical protein